MKWASEGHSGVSWDIDLNGEDLKQKPKPTNLLIAIAISPLIPGHVSASIRKYIFKLWILTTTPGFHPWNKNLQAAEFGDNYGGFHS